LRTREGDDVEVVAACVRRPEGRIAAVPSQTFPFVAYMLSRPSLMIVARLMIGVFLFGQLAVAAYACPGLSRAQAEVAVDMVEAQGVEAPSPQVAHVDPCSGTGAGFDPAAPNLCAEYCKFGHQGDRTVSAIAPDAVPIVLHRAPSPPLAPSLRRRAAADLGELAAACPPHAVLHCVYRL